MVYNVTLNDLEKVCNSCTIYIVLLIIPSITSITLMGIGSVYIYFYWYTIKNCFNKLPY